MIGRRKAFVPNCLDRLEDRLTLSHLGVDAVTQVGHHHPSLGLAPSTTPGRVHPLTHVEHHYQAARVRHHHHWAHLHNHQSGSVAPGAGSNSTAHGSNSGAPGTIPTTPGAIPTAPGAAPTGAANPPTVAALVLDGQIKGNAPMDGSGTVGPLGAVTSTGTLTAKGAEPVTYAGTISLVGASGTITLSLSGRQFGPVSIGKPIDLTYTITGGTGAFQDATGNGKVVLSFDLPPGIRTNPSPPPNSFVFTFA